MSTFRRPRVLLVAGGTGGFILLFAGTATFFVANWCLNGLLGPGAQTAMAATGALGAAWAWAGLRVKARSRAARVGLRALGAALLLVGFLPLAMAVCPR